jgi:hypothetical protein
LGHPFFALLAYTYLRLYSYRSVFIIEPRFLYFPSTSFRFQATWLHYDQLWEAAFAKIQRQQRLQRFKAKRRALYQVARDLCGDDFEQCVVLWGNGSFSPSFGKGNAPAPNKMLYSFLVEQGVSVIIVDESYSSQISPCHFHDHRKLN